MTKQLIALSFIGSFIMFFLVITLIDKKNNKEFKSTSSTNSNHLFVGSNACQKCHPTQFQEWLGSDHQLSMQEATENTVLGDFSSVQYTHKEITSRFFKRDKFFWISTEGSEGKMEEFKIKYTLGIKPLQQYIIEFPNGTLQSFNIAWDTRKKEQGGQKWFSLSPNEKIPFDDWFHWTKGAHNWNYNCAHCHTTNLQKNYEPHLQSYKTSWSEFNISCEACHGAGRLHTENTSKAELLNSLKGLRQIETCARCHSRSVPLDNNPDLTDKFTNHFLPTLLTEDGYHPDGQIKGEVFEYGSFLQSKMFRKGVVCTDCHQPHQLKLKAEGNQLCLRCHQQRYAKQEHHHHSANSNGSQCIECHMPSQNFMIVDKRRDHKFGSPHPDLTEKWGIPNACSQCHIEKNISWIKQFFKKWYPTSSLKSPVFLKDLDKNQLLQIIQDQNLASIYRATAVHKLSEFPIDKEILQVATSAIRSTDELTDELIRWSILPILENLSSDQRINLITPFLKDPIRIVRHEAVISLSSIDLKDFPLSQQDVFSKALLEYENFLTFNSDSKSGLKALAQLRIRQNRWSEAEEHMKHVVAMDPRDLDNLEMLINLIRQSKMRK